MAQETVSIRTADGECPTHVFTPEGKGSWPAAIFYMDGLAIRPTLFQMAQRLADGGYVVLLPDLFYRAGPYEPFDPKEVFGGGDVMAVIGKYFATTDNRKAADDTEDLDTVTNDLLIGHLHELELFHWFVRAHLESAGGELSTHGATTEKAAARSAGKAAKEAEDR